MQHAEIAALVEEEKQRFDLWPEKMAKLDDTACRAAEKLVQLEREHQDQVCGLIVGVLAVAACGCHDTW